jgi:hypothetical protein
VFDRVPPPAATLFQISGGLDLYADGCTIRNDEAEPNRAGKQLSGQYERIVILLVRGTGCLVVDVAAEMGVALNTTGEEDPRQVAALRRLPDEFVIPAPGPHELTLHVLQDRCPSVIGTHPLPP